MATNISKSLVMKAAWSIVKKAEVQTISEALKLSWKAIKLKAAMAKGVMEFTFRKANGEIRKAIGTLQPEFINYESKGTTRQPCYSTVAYWDLERHAFRSFSIASLI